MYQQTRAPWLLAALADFRDPRCRGDFPSEERESIELLNLVTEQASQGDREALAVLLQIQSLNRPLDALQQSPWPERLAAANVARR